MEPFLVSAGLVALAEFGDKSQLLAFVLASRFRRPLPVLLGILAATLFNHGVAAAIGVWLTALMGPETLRALLGLSFIAMAVWVLVPEKPDGEPPRLTGLGVFGATLVAFCLAEMGDKTQAATVALAAGYASVVSVVAGTTLGMMIASIPAVYFGDRCSERFPITAVRGAAAGLFALFGIATWWGVGS